MADAPFRRRDAPRSDNVSTGDPGERSTLVFLLLAARHAEPFSVALVFVIGWIFRGALEGGQFDDLERPAQDILADKD